MTHHVLTYELRLHFKAAGEPYNDRGIAGVIVDIADLDNFEAKFNLEPIK